MKSSRLAAILSGLVDANKLIIYHNPLGTLTFDPAITTSSSTTVIWDTEQGRTITTGTTHNLSYTPTAGSKVCKVTVLGGISLVTSIVVSDDAITSLRNLSKLSSLTTLNVGNTTSVGPLVVNLAEIPRSVTDLRLQSNTTGISGALSNAPRGLVTFYAHFDSAITGGLDGLPPTLLTCYLYNAAGLTPGSIAHITGIRDLRVQNNAWTEAQVDAVIDAIYQAVVADANHFTYAGPIVLQIGGSGGTVNAAPSGTYQLATPPTTGLEKVYYLCHLAAHAWSITWNGGVGP